MPEARTLPRAQALRKQLDLWEIAAMTPRIAVARVAARMRVGCMMQR